MSYPLRNAADVIDVVSDLDDVYAREVDHHGEPENYGTFTLEIEVPVYERVENAPARSESD